MAIYQVEGPNGSYQIEGPDDADPSSVISQMSGGSQAPAAAAAPAQAQPGIGGWLKNNVGIPLARSGINAVTALPFMAQDFGVAARDLIQGKNANGNYPYELPSHVFQQALQQYLPAPTTPEGKLSEMASSTIMGLGIGGPSGIGTSADQVPANFVRSANPAQQSLAQAQQAGYTIPPATTNPSIPNKIIESFGGKVATQQDAAQANMPVTDMLARRALGLAPDTDLTPEILQQGRAAASGAKAAMIAQSGPAVNLDDQFANNVANIVKPYQDAAAELGDRFGNPQLVQAAEAISKPQMTPKVAASAIDTLRGSAQTAFRSGDNVTGAAYKGLATNLEDAIDRHLVSTGNTDLVNAYRDARVLQAKSFDVENALNTSTGHINAGYFGNVLKRGGYLTGDLKTIGQTARLAPKATQEILDSGSVRNTDVALGMVGAVAEHSPAFLLYPFARQGARAAMLSQGGQQLLSGTPTPAYGLGALSQSLIAQWDLAK